MVMFTFFVMRSETESMYVMEVKFFYTQGHSRLVLALESRYPL